jgi:hypothetical protein
MARHLLLKGRKAVKGMMNLEDKCFDTPTNKPDLVLSTYSEVEYMNAKTMGLHSPSEE